MARTCLSGDDDAISHGFRTDRTQAHVNSA
jgi:hypothetical protein